MDRYGTIIVFFLHIYIKNSWVSGKPACFWKLACLQVHQHVLPTATSQCVYMTSSRLQSEYLHQRHKRSYRLSEIVHFKKPQSFKNHECTVRVRLECRPIAPLTGRKRLLQVPCKTHAHARTRWSSHPLSESLCLMRASPSSLGAVGGAHSDLVARKLEYPVKTHARAEKSSMGVVCRHSQWRKLRYFRVFLKWWGRRAKKLQRTAQVFVFPNQNESHFWHGEA